jgi:methyltransferase family protein
MRGMNNAKIASFLAAQVKKHPALAELLNQVTRQTYGDKIVFLDYPVNPRQRWSRSNPHSELWDIINGNRPTYIELLKSFLVFQENFVAIPERQTADSSPLEPSWINGWMPALDGVALYSLIAIKRPKYFLEVGSGNSTKFARKAITDHRLNTKIISIDPHPRVEIDMLCDNIIREPVEAVGLDTFDRLESGDILYVDNSHRVFMNSDATVIFLDVIPRLKPGVLVQIHDVMLPHDYPTVWIDRFYSEQYLLAAYLLARGHRINILLPNAFISGDNELSKILTPLWQDARMKNVETHGVSFWFQIN